MSIVSKLAGVVLFSLGIQSSFVYAQALRPGAPAQNAQPASANTVAPAPAPSVATLPPSSPATQAAMPAATVAPATVQAAPVENQPQSSAGKSTDVNPFIPSKPNSSASNAAPQPVAQPGTAGALGQTLAAPGAVQPNFNGQFPISNGQLGVPAPAPAQPEEAVHPVIERGTYIGKVNGKPIYKAPREYYFDKPGADVIYKPKQDVAPVADQTNQPGQRNTRPGQRTTNTNR